MKLYVKNLSADVDDQAVKKLFAEFGRVESARVISDKTSGHSKIKAVVKMGSDAEGKVPRGTCLRSVESNGFVEKRCATKGRFRMLKKIKSDFCYKKTRS